MGAEPVWCLFKVPPTDVFNVKQVFEQAVERSQISYKLQNFLQKRTEYESKFHARDKEIFNYYIPKAFVDKQQTPDAFDWDDLHHAYHLFFPRAFAEIFDNLFIGEAPIISVPMSQALLELVRTNRVGAPEMLWGGLGWERAGRLPGYLGNMFVPPEDIAVVLGTLEEVFQEVPSHEFIQGVSAIGTRGNGNEQYVESLQSLILSCFYTVFKEGNGLLALSHPHLGSMPFPENYGFSV
ncbi:MULTISPECIES: hypothetical protein [Nostocales]|uniref:Uncharacterized protein n=3 Tax=Nostocales TaxID=1161 RepID=A0A0C1QVK1_9CYAN|nr:hypothetical protein [Tolypothrix bouteillei]KAF3888670.1 hypothetical protein DA73_0400026705 [Tolypothrix bouteillei VB521301]